MINVSGETLKQPKTSNLIHNPVADHQIIGFLHNQAGRRGFSCAKECVERHSLVNHRQQVRQECRFVVLKSCRKQVRQLGTE